MIGFLFTPGPTGNQPPAPPGPPTLPGWRRDDFEHSPDERERRENAIATIARRRRLAEEWERRPKTLEASRAAMRARLGLPNPAQGLQTEPPKTGEKPG